MKNNCLMNGLQITLPYKDIADMWVHEGLHFIQKIYMLIISLVKMHLLVCNLEQMWDFKYSRKPNQYDINREGSGDMYSKRICRNFCIDQQFKTNDDEFGDIHLLD